MLQPISKVTDWPIMELSRRREEIIQYVIEDSIKHLETEFPKAGEFRDIVAKTLYLEKIRIKNEPWKVDPKDDRKFWAKVKKDLFDSDPAKVDKEEANEVAHKLLREIVVRYTLEITTNFNPKVYGMAKWLLPHFFARMLNASTGNVNGIFKPKDMLEDKLFITGPIQKIRKLLQIGTVVLLPTHFSNLDSIILGFGLDHVGFPMFQYGAGLNLFNSKLLGFFMGNLGSYKLDRRKKNPIYLETLKSFSKINITNGAHTIFFPGGTRSRSGSIENRLKLGLLGTVIESQRMNFERAEAGGQPPEKIFILPLTMSYHFVLEAKTLIEQHLKMTGKESYITIDDEFSSFYKVSKFFWQTFAKSSDITLSMSDPIDILGNRVDDEGNSIDKNGNNVDLKRYFITRGELKADRQREMQYTYMLGEIVLKKLLEANTVFSSHMVAFVAFELIRRKFPKSDLFTVLRTPEEDWELHYDDFVLAVNRTMERLYEMEKEGALKLAPHMHDDIENVINHGITNIGIYHSKEPLLKSEDGTIVSEDIKLLLFYHNRMEGYGLEAYI